MKRIATFKDFVGELKVNYTRTEKATVQITSSKTAADFMREYFMKLWTTMKKLKFYI